MPQKIVFGASDIDTAQPGQSVTFGADDIGQQAQAPQPASQAGSSWLDLATSGVSGVVSGLISPVKLLKNIYEDSSAEMDKAVAALRSGDVLGAAKSTLKSSPAGQSARMLGGLAAAHWDQILKGKQAYDEGRTSEALGHTMAGLLPALGPMAAHVGEEIGSGDPRRAAFAVGEAASVLVPGAVAKVLPKSVSVGGRFKNTNPTEAAAVQYAERAGIPMDAATATGSPIIKGAQKLTDYSIGGAIPGQRFVQKQTEAVTREAGNLAARAHPTPVSQEMAGAGVRTALTDEIVSQHGAANKAYGDLRAIEAAAPLPVDLAPVLKSLKPIHDQLAREAKLVPLMGDKAKALTVLDRMFSGPTVVRASVADAALSDLKALARTTGLPELRGPGKGIASVAVRELEDAVQRAVAQGGPAAVAARDAGRAATKQKYTVAEILEDLKTEPVRAYRQATLPGDQNIAYLRLLRKIAPQEMLKVGRAFLGDLFDMATAEGGFSRAQGLYAKWQALGPETKKILFPDAGLRSDLDNFFLVTKKIADNPNPSGSGLMAGLMAQGWTLLNPVTGAKYVLGGYALSKLFRTRAGVKLLTETLTIPVAQKARAAAATSRVAALAGLTAKDRVALVPAMAGESEQTPP